MSVRKGTDVNIFFSGGKGSFLPSFTEGMLDSM